MIGNFWSTGIVLSWDGREKWWARAKFLDDGHAMDGSAQLKLRTTYALPIEQAIDTVMQDVEKLGIEFRAVPCISPHLYIENEDAPTAPDNWREILQEQAARIGWGTYGAKAAIEKARSGESAAQQVVLLDMLTIIEMFVEAHVLNDSQMMGVAVDLGQELIERVKR